MKTTTIPLHDHRSHANIVQLTKSLLLVVAGGITLSLVLISVQPLTYLSSNYRHFPTRASSSPLPAPVTAAASLLAINEVKTGDGQPENDRKAIAVAAAITGAADDAPAGTEEKARAARPPVMEASATAADKALLEENSRRNSNIVKELALVSEMHECHFNTASTDLAEDNLMKELDSSVARCVQSPGAWSRIIVLGFTDNRGRKINNVKLGMVRAEKLKARLIAKGISAERITIASFGPELPIDNNTTESGRARNRRAELNVLSPVGELSSVQ